MATLNPVIVPAKALKGGRHKVRISVAHNGETRYIVTDIIIDSDKEFRNGSIVRRGDAAMLNTKLRGLIQQYQTAIDELGYTNGLSCAELVTSMKDYGRTKNRTLQSVFEEYISTNTRIKASSRQAYEWVWVVISSHLKGETLLQNITPATIVGLDRYLLTKRKLSTATARTYMTFFRVLLNYAQRYGYVQFRVDPFVSYKMPPTCVRQAWLTVEEIRRIRDLKTTRRPLAKMRDLFMLSYYLGGMNPADLVRINFGEFPDRIRYARKKIDKGTNQSFVEFKLQPEAKELLKRMTGPDGRLKLSDYQRKQCLGSFCGAHMFQLAEAAGIPNLIFYSARKSFAQHAFDLGVNTSVIDYVLGHKVEKGTTALFSYIRVTPDMATDCVRKVLQNLK